MRRAAAGHRGRVLRCCNARCARPRLATRRAPSCASGTAQELLVLDLVVDPDQVVPRPPAPLRGHRPQDPPLDRLSLRCAGPSGPAELDRVTGKRVVVSLDPRRKKRGPKTATDSIPTGRNRSTSSDDATVSRRPRSSTSSGDRRRCRSNAADKVRRRRALDLATHPAPHRCARALADTGAGADRPPSNSRTKLRRWSATQRTRWLNRTRGLLKRARVDEVITALVPRARRQDPHALNYFLPSSRLFGLPKSAIRRPRRSERRRDSSGEVFAADGHDAAPLIWLSTRIR